MTRANKWFSPSGSLGPGRFATSVRLRSPRDRRRFRPTLTGLEDRRLLTNYTLTDLASFSGSPGGDFPGARLLLDGQGNLYGTTTEGGDSGDGTVFEIAQGSSTVTVLVSFDGTDGSDPHYIIQDAQGNLYGTTQDGGANGCGTVFEIANGSNSITTLASFDRSDGAFPSGGLVVDDQGNLYGTTSEGGSGDAGTLFEIAKGSKTVTDVVAFDYADGENPDGLLLDAQGDLYGNAEYGTNGGSVFEIAKGSSTMTTLATFDNANGIEPQGNLVMDSQGNLYGTTTGGEVAAGGTVFEISHGSNTFTTLASFNDTGGYDPIGGVVIDGQGNLYGTTLFGGDDGAGTVFEVASGSNTITTLANFDVVDGTEPYGGVIMDGEGNLYGTTSQGGGGLGYGTVFELSPQTTTTTVTGASSPNPSVYGQSVTLSATVAPATATGTVTFYDGTTNLGSATLDDGTATFATSALSVGSDAITASYGGDANDAAGTSPAFTQVVNQDGTTTSVTASPSPQYVGQPVTLTATVLANSPGSGTPTGTSTFYDGTTTLGTATLSNGTATLSTTALPVGSDAITASYAGDANDAASTSPGFTQVVNAGSSQPYSITINGQDGPWEFVEGGLNSNYSYGVGDQQPPAIMTAADGLSFAPGTVLDIQYVSGLEDGGRGVYTDANGVTTITPANGEITDHFNFPSYYFDPSDWPAYEAEVVGTFADSNGEIVGTPFNIGDQRTVVVPAGASQLEMGFNDNFFEDNLGSITMEVTAVPGVSVTETSNPNPSVYGQSVTLSATVSPTTATGMVTFYDGTTSLGTATLVDGTATLVTSALPVGSDAITASYGGDANDPAGTSPAFTQIVNQDGTTTSVTASPSPQYAGQPVTLSATVSANGPGAGTSTGMVTFYDGTTALGTATLGDNEIATLANLILDAGANAITATYSGDTDFTTSTSVSTTETVNLIASSVALAPSTNPANRGQSVTLTATAATAIGVDGTPTGNVVFQDAAGALGMAPLVDGVATLTTTLSPGSYAITASYGPTADFAASTSNTVTEVVSNYAFNTLASFGGINGALPIAGAILDAQGNLYGTTFSGGSESDGTVFEIAKGSNAITILASFDGSDGQEPTAGLVLDSQGNLYGTTEFGGTSGDGTVFEIVKGSDSITTLSSFIFGNGMDPTAGLVLDSQGDLYGTTANGGAYGDGTAFEIVQGSNAITTLASFNGTNGEFPDGGVVLDAQGNLYGTTEYGGVNGDGTVFEILKGSGAISPLAAFNNTNGSGPQGGVSLDSQGDLFGTTEAGGANGFGTVFELAMGSSSITTVAAFGGSNGRSPQGGVVLDSQGDLFGATDSGGYNGQGTVFEIVQGTGTITTLTAFNNSNGQSPQAGVILDSQGDLFGTTQEGGANGFGTVFELSPQATVTMKVASSSNPSVYGQSVTLTATVAPSTATGTVTFYNGTTILGTGTFVNGIATLATSVLAVGTDPITVSYGGDLNDRSGTSPAFDQVVNQDPTTTALTSSNNPQFEGQSITLTATVSPSTPGSGTPTGLVEFLDGSTDLGTVTLSGNDTATLTMSTLPIGSDAITAQYPGDANFMGGTSPILQQVIQKLTTTTTVTSTPDPSVFGQPVTLSVTVVPSTATGTVTFYDGPTALGTGTLVNGTSTFTTTTALPVGSNAITASYGGDAIDATDTSPVFEQVVNQDGTTTTVTAAPNPQYAGQPVTLTATVSANSPGAGAPTGTVTYYDGTTNLGTVSLNGNDIATLANLNLAAGTHSITATYVGDTDFTTSRSTATTEPVNLVGTTVSLAPSANPADPNQSMTFTATVVPAISVDGTPSGDVVFQDAAGVLGTAPLVDGVATLTVSFPPGSYAVTAFYGATVDFAAGTSSAVAELVLNYQLTTLASFNGNGQGPGGNGHGSGGNGQGPGDIVLDDQGNLYGTTEYGGASFYGESLGDGTVFEIARGSNKITSLAFLEGTGGGEGANPTGDVVEDGQGDLFGTTEYGGANNDGTVFELANGSDQATILASFNGGDGMNPEGGVVMDGQGNLYGTTHLGGADVSGTVFEIAKGSNTITTLASFNYPDSGSPVGGMVLDSQGDLFGTTQSGGAYFGGTVFEIAKGSNTITILASFNVTDGSYPFGDVVLDSQGNLYGTTLGGGPSDDGTVFEIAKGSNTVTTLTSFNGGDGENPLGNIVLDGQDNLYGTTEYGGANNDGTVFEIAKGSNTITDLVSFNGIGGSAPTEGLVLDGQGNLLGTTFLGGASNDGTVFELSIPLSSHVKNALGTSQSTDTFPVSVSYSDPAASWGAPTTGVTSVSLYDSVNNGPFTLYQTQTLSTPTVSGTVTFTFAGQDRNIYAFHSIAEDAAGNIESKSSNAIEASTSVPDLNPPVTHILASTPSYSWGPYSSSDFSGLIPSSYSDGVFTLNWAGADPDQDSGTPAGSIALVDIYVEIDGGSPTLIGQLNGGTPNGSGVYTGSMTYDALGDGLTHTYRFFSVGVDDEQKAQYAAQSGPAAPDMTFSNIIYTTPLAVENLLVEKGIAERSFIQYLDVDFNQTVTSSSALQALSSGLSGDSAGSYVELLWYGEDLNASSTPQGSVNLFGAGTTASLAMSGNDLSINFGANGITSLLTETKASGTGSPTSSFGDGWYALGIDPTGNPSNGQTFWLPFFRLLGSATGDLTVTGPYTSAGTDAYTVYHAEGQSGTLLDADVNGDGAINSKDLTETVEADGHAVGATPPESFPQFQLFAGTPAVPGHADAVTQEQVQALLPTAIAAWQAAGLNTADVRELEGVTVQVAGLGTNILGLEAGGAITINQTAAGYNWYVSASPGSSQAFGVTGPNGETVAKSESPAADDVDLLTVLEHELGHVIGLSDNAEAGDLMDITLGLGVRRSPTAADLTTVAGLSITPAPAMWDAAVPTREPQPIPLNGSVSCATVDAALASIASAAVVDGVAQGPSVQPVTPAGTMGPVPAPGATPRRRQQGTHLARAYPHGIASLRFPGKSRGLGQANALAPGSSEWLRGDSE
jgi:large repetitive protein